MSAPLVINLALRRSAVAFLLSLVLLLARLDGIAAVTVPLTEPRLGTNAHFEARVQGPAGRFVVVESSTNFLHWLTLETNTGDFAIHDPAGGFPRRFYRALAFLTGTNRPPSITLDNPDGGRFYSGTSAMITLQATPSDTDGVITNVTFLQGTNPVAVLTAPPWRCFLTNVASGSHSFKATAWDDYGAPVTSSTAAITVTNNLSLLDTSSFLGGSSTNDLVREAEIQSDGTIVIAANISSAQPSGVTPVLLNGASSNTSGAILRLSPNGQTVLSVSRLAADVRDLALDTNDNIYVAAGTNGLLKLNPIATAVLWQRENGGNCNRVDAAGDGHCVGLRDGMNFAGTGGAHRAYVYDAAGNALTNIAGPYNRVYDVAIHGPSATVYLTGFNQTSGNPAYGSLPVQVAYLRAYGYDGAQKWRAYGWTGLQVDEPNENNMADTRGLRVSVGRDGWLYAVFMCAGGNHIFRRDPFNLTNTAPIVGGDQYHGFWNSSSEHKTCFGRYDPVTGAIQLGQQLTARLGSTRASTCWCEKGNIKADEAGRVYLAGITGTGFPFRFNPVPDTEYEGGPFALVMSSNFQTRQFAGRVASSGYMHTIATRTLPGDSAPQIVFGGQWTAATLWTANPLQAGPNASRQGFFCVKERIPLP